MAGSGVPRARAGAHMRQRPRSDRAAGGGVGETRARAVIGSSCKTPGHARMRSATARSRPKSGRVVDCRGVQPCPNDFPGTAVAVTAVRRCAVAWVRSDRPAAARMMCTHFKRAAAGPHVHAHAHCTHTHPATIECSSVCSYVQRAQAQPQRAVRSLGLPRPMHHEIRGAHSSAKHTHTHIHTHTANRHNNGTPNGACAQGRRGEEAESVEVGQMRVHAAQAHTTRRAALNAKCGGGGREAPNDESRVRACSFHVESHHIFGAPKKNQFWGFSRERVFNGCGFFSHFFN